MKRFSAVLVLCILLIISLSGCGSAKARTIRIGAAGPFTGDLSKIGLDSLNAIKMAVDEFNESGGVDGKIVEVVLGDDGGDPAKGNIVADKFVGDSSLLGVVGPMNSSVVNAALPIYEKAGLVLISQSGTTSDLTDRGFKVMNRICPRDDAQGKAAAMFIAEELGAGKVYILDDKSTYGQGLADEVAENLADLGSVEVKRDQVGTQDKEFSSLVTRIKAFGPDLVYTAFGNPAQAAALIKQTVSSGAEPAFMAGDGCREKDQLIGGGGDAVQGMFVTAIGRDLKEVDEAKDFVQRFESKHTAMSIFSGQSYEATKILLAAIKEAAKAGNLHRAGVREAVRATEDFQGILGFPISFDSKGDVVGGEILVLTVKGDDFAEVKEYATGAF